MAQTPEAAEASMIRNLEEKTGRKWSDWLELAMKSGRPKHGELVKFLKEEHGLGHGYANLVALRSSQGAQGSSASPEDLVGAQYAGPKAALRPLYETLMTRIRKFGTDVEVSPKKGYVSLRRSKQFALIQPSTATRLDVGINLKGTPPTERLEVSGSFNAMVTHRVRVSRAEDLDEELERWLRKAYESA
ncbi:MAG: DUF4287 domain-containing protein [Acidobacteria bacterium]|nr:DUF4287 domain-containing protein [Acidobacteriota bacterium]